MTISGPTDKTVIVRGEAISDPYRIFSTAFQKPATIQNLTLANGSSTDGGAIYNSQGVMTVSNCIFDGNSASNGGGAIWNDINSTLTITNCTFTGNTASGGNGGAGGGAVLNRSSNTMSVSRCTFVNNSANDDNAGGGIQNFGQFSNATVTNCTFNGNSAMSTGGGIHNSGTINIVNCTISGNTGTLAGGGIGNVGVTGTINLTNTIVAGNISDSVGSKDINTDTDPDTRVNNVIGGDPKLEALAGNGGPTQTMALMQGSPAINAGTSSGAPGTDQRGFSRFGSVDIGAYELQSVAPEVSDIAKTVNEDATATFSAADFDAGFSDANGNTLQKIKITSLPTSGYLKLSNDPVEADQEVARANLGDLTYTPSADFNGSDSFGWNGYDGTFYAATPALANITITPVNDAPSFFEGGDVTVDQDSGAYSAEWAANLSPGPPDEETQVLTFDVSNDNNDLFDEQPAISATGILTFTPATGQTGSAKVTFTLSDDGGVENGGVDRIGEVTFNIFVASVNHPPTVEAIEKTTPEDTGISIELSGEDADENLLTFQITSLPAHGDLYDGTDDSGHLILEGELPYTLAGADVFYQPDADYNGPDSFGFGANDGASDSIASQVSITVTPVNDEPIAIDGEFTTNEEEPIDIDLSTLVSDIETADGDLVYSIEQEPGALVGTGVLNGSIYTFTPATDIRGATLFKYKVTDTGDPSGTPENTEDSGTKTVVINITPVNDVPIAEDGIATTDEDVPVDIDLSLLVSDAETIDEDLEYTIVTAPNAAEGSLSGTGSTRTFTPTANFNGEASFTFKVRDTGDYTEDNNASDSATKTVTITVKSIPDAPVLAPIGNKTVKQPYNVSFTASATDGDSGQTLTFSIFDGPADATIDPSTGAFSWTPSGAQPPGSYSVTIKVTDNDDPALSDEETFTIQLKENSAPVLPFVGARTLIYGGTTTFNFAASDADIPQDTLTYSLVGAPAGANINPSTGVFTWTPTAAQANPASNFYSFKIKVVDDGYPAKSDEETASFTVVYPANINVNTTNPSLKANNLSQSVTFTYTVRNNTGAAISNLQVKGDVFWPSTLQSVVLTPSAGTTGQVFSLTNTSKWVQWTIPSLPAGTSKTISVKLTGVVPTNAPQRSRIASGWTVSSVTTGVIPSMSAPEVFLNTYK